jgi:hypothetical protein
MLINIQQSQYVTQGGSTAGIVVLPLDQNIMPFPEDDGLLVNPGYATSISLTTVSHLRINAIMTSCKHCFIV